MRASPAVRRFLGRQGARLVKRGVFSADEARTSLETSLRELRTDYVDIFLLHDCALEDCSAELLEFLRDAVSAGKVRAFGVGTSVESAVAIARAAPEFATVLQFEHSVLRPAVDKVDPAGSRATITHGTLAGLSPLRRYLDNNPDIRAHWSAELRLDLTHADSLATAAIQYASRTNPCGPTLFSSTRTKHIVRNAASAREEPSLSLDRFASLVSGALPAAAQLG
jgi:D-threo-aldose 1-dehydrogenase